MHHCFRSCRRSSKRHLGFQSSVFPGWVLLFPRTTPCITRRHDKICFSCNEMQNWTTQNYFIKLNFWLSASSRGQDVSCNPVSSYGLIPEKLGPLHWPAVQVQAPLLPKAAVQPWPFITEIPKANFTDTSEKFLASYDPSFCNSKISEGCTSHLCRFCAHTASCRKRVILGVLTSLWSYTWFLGLYFQDTGTSTMYEVQRFLGLGITMEEKPVW